MSEEKMVGRRQLLSLFANDLKYLGSNLIPAGAWELAKVGTAKIDQQQCLAYREQLCTACYNACTLKPKAIELVTGRYPKIKETWCNGCEDCVKACLAPLPAITVPTIPFKVATAARVNGR